MNQLSTFLLSILASVIATIICGPSIRQLVMEYPFQSFVVFSLIIIMGVLTVIAVKLKKGQGH